MVSIFCSIVFDNGVFGYDTSVAHPNIVGLATEVYNRFSNQKLTIEQINWIKKGAEDEDMPTRWFNHFYDPVHNTGFKSLYSTAKKWSNDAKDQANYALGDYSWDRAINDYGAGDEEQALIGLGHVIHLVSDMTVPAHTRDDAHPTGDSLEQYIKNNWASLVKNIKVKNILK